MEVVRAPPAKGMVEQDNNNQEVPKRYFLLVKERKRK